MKIFSGIRPTGQFHLGNYLGAIKQWVKLSNSPAGEENDCIFSIVDLHALTTPFDPKALPQMIIDGAKDVLAAGIDPEKSILFLQSDRPEHLELAWILNTITKMGELNRMTQYKEKSEKYEQLAGLFNYPVLMAADILIYRAEGVPVGEDQVQHVELSRDLARRMNDNFGIDFSEPKVLLRDEKRILGLDGKGKMSKTNAPSTYIALNDSPDIIHKKIAGATTDQGNEAEISAPTKNLLGLMEVFGGADVAAKYLSARQAGTIKYSEFKPALAEAIVKELEPFQKRRAEITDDEVKDILNAGAEKLKPLAQQTISEVKKRIGLAI